jgi:hypothetical protein
MTNRRLIILIGLMLALAGALWFDHGWWGDSDQTLPGAVAATTPNAGEQTERLRRRATASELAAINPLGDWSAEALSEVLDRPLFNPSRRAAKPTPVPQPEPEAPEPVVAEALDVTLIGVLLGDKVRFAILKENGSGKMLRLKEGQSVEDWTLEEVGLREAIVARGEERTTLKLFEEKRAGTAPQPAVNEAERAAQDEVDKSEDESEADAEPEKASAKKARRERVRRFLLNQRLRQGNSDPRWR